MAKELYVGPFPSILNVGEKEQFLLYFGAVKVTHILKKDKELYAVARFKSVHDCQYALKKIHQIDLFGTRISAKFYDEYKQLNQQKNKTQIYSDMFSSEVKDSNTSLKEALLNYESQLSAINANFGLYNPISPKLRYVYPPPTSLVLCNIAHTLVAVPKFYTQVLHLMNKMNLPCPFGPLTEEPPLCKEAKLMTKVFNTEKENSENPQEIFEKRNKSNADEIISHYQETESESELESDEEIKSMFIKEKNKPKRIARTKPKRVIKKPKLETLKQSLLVSKEAANQEPKNDAEALQKVFEIGNLSQKRTLNLKVQSTKLVGGTNLQEEIVTEGFGKIYPQSRESDSSEPKESAQYISLEELSKNRIPSTDWPIVPVFKNYNPGTPSTRLYIKNLAKTVTENDLRFIFGRYLTSIKEETSKFNIRLMKDGRMKGQAFVNFCSEETASKAIEEVNGFILKDKPMVIVFGKVKANE